MENRIHKVIITGTGRTGTTFLVRLLTEIGLDTGFTPKTWRDHYGKHCHAGLESDILSPQAPYIVKNPALCDTLPAVLATQRFVIDHAFIPVRQLDAAAQSRARVGGQYSSVPGGLVKTADPANQKAVLAEFFHELVHTLVAHEIPCTFLAFPRLVQDPDYTYTQLQFLLKDVTRERFRRVFARVSNPRLVHVFPENPPPLPAGRVTPPAAAYARGERNRRLFRRLKRLSTHLAAAAAAMILLAGVPGAAKALPTAAKSQLHHWEEYVKKLDWRAHTWASLMIPRAKARILPTDGLLPKSDASADSRT